MASCCNFGMKFLPFIRSFIEILTRFGRHIKALKRNHQNFSEISVPHVCVDQHLLSTYTWLLGALLLFPFGLAAQNVSSGSAQRDSVLVEYLAEIDGCDIPTKISECDFIISSCTDSLLRGETARRVFTHFKESHLMGDENVAVWVAEKWILPKGDGKVASETSSAEAPNSVTTASDSVETAIREYVRFNRESLLGMAAPLLPEAGLSGWDEGHYTVLYFYDTDCPVCKVERLLLEGMLSRHPECRLIAFYTGTDTEKWKTFRSEGFPLLEGRVTHLCDLQEESGFKTKYSVTATPRLFLIDHEGTIVGRMLDSESLETLLEQRNENEKQAVAQLFYQLVPRRGEEAKEALEYIIDRHILCPDSIFNTSEDSLMVVNFALMQKDLLSKAKPGTKIASIKVRGRLNGGREKQYRLDRVSRRKGGLIIVFHTTGCRQCEEELDKAALQKRNTLEINIDEIEKSSPETFSALIENFDLTTLPLLIETDRRGKILRRYFSL